jgi:RHS repeat-associated protein
MPPRQPDGTVENRHYVSGAGGLIGVHVTKSGAAPEMRYYHRDHLGSIVAITNEAGAVTERLAYEAFGKRRFPNGTADPNNNIFGVQTERGFTAHEHLDELGLVHMNGRVYDPLLGRFMTPDSIVQNVGLQGFNRYSYAINNPLGYVDPNGHCFECFAIGAIIGGTVAAIASGGDFAAIFEGAFIGGISGGLGGLAGAGVSTLISGQVVAGAVGGAVAGAVSARLYREMGYDVDVLKSTRAGLVGGAVGAYVRGLPISTPTLAGLAGGASAAYVAGADVRRGARNGLVSSILAGLFARILAPPRIRGCPTVWKASRAMKGRLGLSWLGGIILAKWLWGSLRATLRPTWASSTRTRVGTMRRRGKSRARAAQRTTRRT